MVKRDKCEAVLLLFNDIQLKDCTLNADFRVANPTLNIHVCSLHLADVTHKLLENERLVTVIKVKQ